MRTFPISCSLRGMEPNARLTAFRPFDLNLPTQNGLETYLRIREFRPKVVTVAITGHGQELGGMAGKIVENNAYTCLEKPLDMEELWCS